MLEGGKRFVNENYNEGGYEGGKHLGGINREIEGEEQKDITGGDNYSEYGQEEGGEGEEGMGEEGDGITKIGKSNFEGGNKIKTVILPDTLKEIEEYAFYNCTSVESMTLPDELEVIG